MKKNILGFIFAAIVMISSLAFMTNKDLTTRSGDEWQLIWSDEFEGPELNTNFWNRQVEKAGRFNEEWQRYTNKKANAYLENNCLVIEAIHHGKKHGMDQYSSARLNTAGKFTFKYGKVSARIKLPYGMGIWPAFWMLGANIDENGGDTSWPLCGEIDILELYGAKNDAVVEANIHYADASGRHAMMGSESFELDRGIFADDFHLFELEWTPKTISWSVDGKTYASTSIASEEFSEFHKEFFLLLNIAVGGTFAGRPDSSSVFPQKMYVDWIRVYQKPE
jgi:beta-glucanase (GH16 family)